MESAKNQEHTGPPIELPFESDQRNAEALYWIVIATS